MTTALIEWPLQASCYTGTRSQIPGAPQSPQAVVPKPPGGYRGAVMCRQLEMPKFAQGCHDCFYSRDPRWQQQGGWKTGGGKPLRMLPPLCRRARARLGQGEGNDGRYFLLFLLFCPLCLLVTSLLPDGSSHLALTGVRVQPVLQKASSAFPALHRNS